MDRTDLLYDHYKETFSIIKNSIIQRNRFFVMVFLVITLQFLFASAPDSISALIVEIFREQYKIDISSQIYTIQSFLWLLLLYLTMRYYQSSVYIEKQYSYISSIEADISNTVQIRFDRESGNYMLKYPKMSAFVDLLYKWVFPIIYCLVICYKIISEFIISKFIFQIMLNTILFLSCFIITILYLVFLHTSEKPSNNF